VDSLRLSVALLHLFPGRGAMPYPWAASPTGRATRRAWWRPLFAGTVTGASRTTHWCSRPGVDSGEQPHK